MNTFRRPSPSLQQYRNNNNNRTHNDPVEYCPGFESNRYDLNQAEQLGAGNKLDDSSSNDEQDVSRALVCTTWASLVFSVLAFCAIQLLTIGLCLAGWLHKNKLKQTGATQMTPPPDEQRHDQRNFLSQLLHHHHQQPQPQPPPPQQQQHRLF
jgi:hypothetical protein